MAQTLQETPPTQLLEDPPDYSELPEDEFREIGEKIATINDLTGWELARWAHDAYKNREWSWQKCHRELNGIKSASYISRVARAYKKFQGRHHVDLSVSHAVEALRAPDGYEEKVLDASGTMREASDAARAIKHIKNFHEERAEIGEIDESKVEAEIEDDFQREVVESDRSASEIKKDLDQQLEYRKNGSGQEWDTAVLDSRLDSIRDEVLAFTDEAPDAFLRTLRDFLQEAISIINDELS